MKTTAPLMAPAVRLPLAGQWLALLPVIIGLAVLYVPTFTDLFEGSWGTERNAHGPIVMVVACVFMYFRVQQMLAQNLFKKSPEPVLGSLLLAFGLVCYALGRSQSVLLLEVGSLVVVSSSLVVMQFGIRTWSSLWFVFFFMLFMIPLPASFVDVVTLPLKIVVSYTTEHLLYWMGYPISRNGVILNIGQYQLLVADACAGLNSLFTLEALGLLYMNLVRHPSLVRNAVLATVIIPISIAANTIRVTFLALITYYMGDAAGQGFLHGFSGMVLFLSALLLIMGIDGLISGFVHFAQKRGLLRTPVVVGAKPAQVAPGLLAFTSALTAKPAIAVLTVMLLTFATAQALTPVFTHSEHVSNLVKDIPKQFGDWTEIGASFSQTSLSTATEGTSLEQPYDDILTRTYVNSDGTQVMLALAYAKEQRQDVKIHLPEVCYQAQGFKVISTASAQMAVLPNSETLLGKHLLTNSRNRMEAVSYWIRIGNAYPQGAFAMRKKIFLDGLAGEIADGMLVRASMVIRHADDANAAYATQQHFLNQLVASLPADKQLLLARAP